MLRADDGLGAVLLLPEPADEVALVLGHLDRVAQPDGAGVQHIHEAGGNLVAVAREEQEPGVFLQFQFGQVAKQDQVLSHKQVGIVGLDH